MRNWLLRAGALFSLTALLSGLFLGSARAQSLLKVLQPQDAAAYARALVAIDDRDWAKARDALGQTRDPLLQGPIWARLLLAPTSPGSDAELQEWLRLFPDQPLAQAVAAEAARRAIPAPPPRNPPRRAFLGAAPAVRGDSASAREAIERIVQRAAANDWAGAEQAARAGLDTARIGQAQFWLGVLALHSGDYAEASRWLVEASAWPYHDAWGKSAALFWGARAALAAGDYTGALRALANAAAFPGTLYGQLAEAQLGRLSAFSFEVVALDRASLVPWIQGHPGAGRAAGLAELGQLGDAELELERLHASLTPADDALFLAFAEALLAPRAQLRAAEYSPDRAAAGFCPTTSFAPADETALDRAAVLAVMRQESRFTPVAISRSNAQGLMQLLPSTAEDLKPGADFRRNPHELHDPDLNTELGQDYLVWLLDRPAVDGDFLLALAAYNGGPGWLGKWLETFSGRADPLLTLEALPRPETRAYVEHVFAYFLLCRSRYGEAAPERDSLASGRPARYQARARKSR